MRATVLVRPKPGILDPQGQAVEGDLRLVTDEGGPRLAGFDGGRACGQNATKARLRQFVRTKTEPCWHEGPNPVPTLCQLWPAVPFCSIREWRRLLRKPRG